MKQKNLVLITGLALVLVMTFSVISAGWFTGKAVDWSTKIYKGNTRAIPGTDSKITISDINLDTRSAVILIDDVGVNDLKEGETANFEEYSVYLREVGKTLYAKWVKVDVKEIGENGNEKSLKANGEYCTIGTECTSGFCENELCVTHEQWIEEIYCNELDNVVKEQIILLKEAREKDGGDTGEINLHCDEKQTYKNGFILIPGCDNKGILLKVTTITNSTTGYSSDAVNFMNVLTGDFYHTVIMREGEGYLSMCGEQYAYSVKYGGLSTVADTSRWVKLMSNNLICRNYNSCDFAKSSPQDVELTDNKLNYVTINGQDYTIELVSASDTVATIQVTKIESKEITEGTTKLVNGLNIQVVNSDETNSELSATIRIM